ncbi:hypothetical protein IWW50_002651 [Coemansia erecta]|nr:hypothetical protein GGF43_003975 [Coemansia sp. RSA 2618]KAJ2825863.1 hypothetical protein IWW50_002651 [Coemansia erecta]
MFARVLSRTTGPLAGRTAARRFESTVKVGESVASAIASRPPAPAPKKKRPVGGFRGGVVGFLLGVTSAGAFGFIYLIDEYHRATSLVLESVAELEQSSLKVKEHVLAIGDVERRLAKLQSSAATLQQLDKVRADWRKQNDILTRDHLELKAHVWELEQDVDAVLGRAKSKKN